MLGHYSVSSPIPTMYLFDAETALHSFLKLFFCLILSFCQGRDKQWNILKVSALIDFAGRNCMYIKKPCSSSPAWPVRTAKPTWKPSPVDFYRIVIH